MSKRSHLQRTLIAACVITAVGFLAAGFLLAHIRASHAALAGRPVREMLPFTAGTKIEARFEATIDGEYEIELEVSRSGSPELIRRHIEIVDRPSAIDVRWQVTAPSADVARGDARDYLYLTGGGDSWIGRWKRFVMGDPFHAGETPTVERGIGRFQARTGVTYTLRAEVGTTLEGFSDLAPCLAVRIARDEWARRTAGVEPLVLLFAGCLSMGTFAGAVAAAAFVVRRRTSVARAASPPASP
jgi:hypothetical protein